jgi:putative PEP-CTERM system TPR-repeat lipoprotein
MVEQRRGEFMGVRMALVTATACMTLVAACTKETPEGLILAAERHLADNDHRTAQIELRNAIQLAPNNGAGHRLLGAALMRGGDPARAESALRKALTLSERTDDVLPTLALALVLQGKFQQLIDEFGNVKLQDPPAAVSFQTSLGQAWLMRGDVKQAGDAFASALALLPGYPPARLGQARTAALGGRIDDASIIVDQVLVSDPRLGEAHALKAQLLLSQGRRAEAIESLEKAIDIDANDVSARVILVSLRIGDREHDKAQVLLDIRNIPSTNDLQIVYLRALLALRKGDLPKARDEVNQILQRAPGHAPTLTLAGEIEFRANSLALAEDLFRKALRSAPDASATRKLLVATYLRQGRPGQAVDALQPLLQESEPKDTQLMALAGEAYLASGDATRAAEFFESSKSGAVNDVTARVRLGQIALRQGDLDRAVSELQAASAMDTERHQADLILVALHLRRHEPQKALIAAEGFTKKQPNNPLGYVLAGTAHLAGKDMTRARQSYESGLKAQSDYLPALRGLTEVDLAEGHASDAKRRYEASIAKPETSRYSLHSLNCRSERVMSLRLPRRCAVPLQRTRSHRPHTPRW